MENSVARQFDRAEASKTEILSLLDGLTDEQLNLEPADGEWSAIQVICHLVRAESLSLRYIRKKMQADNHGAAGVGGRLRSGALSLLLKLPFRYKAPARSAELPEHAELEATRREWEKGRAEWRELVESFPPELADKGIFRHPVAGMMTLSQALRFMADHITRHRGQVQRIVRRVS